MHESKTNNDSCFHRDARDTEAPRLKAWGFDERGYRGGAGGVRPPQRGGQAEEPGGLDGPPRLPDHDVAQQEEVVASKGENSYDEQNKAYAERVQLPRERRRLD